MAPFVTFELILLGVWQWREQRMEVCLDRYFDRLELANKRRLEHFAKLLEHRDVDADRSSKDAQRAIEQFYLFYLFTEIDTLEYVARRYKLGHMTTELADRAVRTFKNRCMQSPEFCVSAKTLTEETEAYPGDIMPVICEVLRETEGVMQSKLRLALGEQEPAFKVDIASSLRWADEGEFHRRSLKAVEDARR